MELVGERKYVGDVTALAVIEHPRRRNRTRVDSECDEADDEDDEDDYWVLTGLGGTVRCYDGSTGAFAYEKSVFRDGTRVHGIVGSRSSFGWPSIAVHGGRSCKVYRSRGAGVGSSGDLEELAVIGPFAHWIMDVVFDPQRESHGITTPLSVGLSDNSIARHSFHDAGTLGSSSALATARCSESSLLYAMSIHASKASLVVAAGTIYNTILVWKYDKADDASGGNASCVPLAILIGHQGSIFRLRWSHDLSLLASCSDDRSARVWAVNVDAVPAEPATVHAQQKLYGHEARLWDCAFVEVPLRGVEGRKDAPLLVTASEDCSCRLWPLDWRHGGKGPGVATVIRGHLGKGVWRVAVRGEMLLTAGLDNALKSWHIRGSWNAGNVSTSFLPALDIKEYAWPLPMEAKELAPLGPVGCVKRGGKGKGKGDWVLELRMLDSHAICVATNMGLLYSVQVDARPVWTLLFRSARGQPITSLHVSSAASEGGPKGSAHHTAYFGDRSGYFGTVRFERDPDNAVHTHTRGPFLEWQPHEGRRVLGIFHPSDASEPSQKDSMSDDVFTSDTNGEVKWWRVDSRLTKAGTVAQTPKCLAIIRSAAGTRVLSIGLSLPLRVIVCGDQRGNVTSFRYPQGLDASLDAGASPRELTARHCLKGQHGGDAVGFIQVRGTEITSGGRDGKMYTYDILPEPHRRPNADADAGADAETRCRGDSSGVILVCTGIRVSKHVMAVESLWACDGSKYVSGFQSSDHVVWNLTDHTEVLRTRCGGWKRPHALHASKDCISFAFVKGQLICTSIVSSSSFMRGAHGQGKHKGKGGCCAGTFRNSIAPTYHGSEIHSVKCLVSRRRASEPCSSLSAPPPSPGALVVLTGSEDACIRQYTQSLSPGSRDSDHECGSSTDLVGQHIAGAAVRAISVCWVHTSPWGRGIAHVSATSAVACGQQCQQGRQGQGQGQGQGEEGEERMGKGATATAAASGERGGRRAFVVSVGAKEVMMVWSFDPENNAAKEKAAFSFVNMRVPQGGLRPKSNGTNRWSNLRFLAVETFAFSTEGVRGCDVLFILAASADASLALTALVVYPNKRSAWFDVASLDQGTTPTLSVSCIVLTDGASSPPPPSTPPSPLSPPSPSPSSSSLAMGGGSTIVAFTGSTDGALAAWDLTGVVRAFLGDLNAHAGGGGAADGVDGEGGNPKLRIDLRTLHPMSVREGVHAAGINTIATAKIGFPLPRPSSSSPSSPFGGKRFPDLAGNEGAGVASICVATGGDDQAMHVSVYRVVCAPQPMTEKHSRQGKETLPCSEGGNGGVRQGMEMSLAETLHISNAHGSAIRGVWTDGTIVATTGIDQRLKIWRLAFAKGNGGGTGGRGEGEGEGKGEGDGGGGRLSCAHAFCTAVEAGETECLDVAVDGGNPDLLHVALAGRGMSVMHVRLKDPAGE